MSDETDLITCEGHGRQSPSFVCQHLAESQPDQPGIGFIWNCEGGDLLANCDACETHADADGFLSDDFFEQNFVMICSECFAELAAVNGVSRVVIDEAIAASTALETDAAGGATS